SNAFQDNDGDPIVWSLGSTPENLTVEIDHDTGTVTITPAEHWFGEEDVTFVASDGEFQTSQTVTVIVLSVNDIPWIATVDGEPVVGDTLEYTVSQGAKLVITYTTDDIEGDEIQADVNLQTVVLDEAARTITFEPGVDAVGTFTFVLRIRDVESPGQKVSLSFTLEVENENDPMEKPRITRPLSGDSYKVNQSFSLTGSCDDPDIQWGQELVFVWVSNLSGELGRGSSITATIMDPGTHEITLTVSDPDFQKTDMIIIVIEPRGGTEPPPPPDDDDTGPGTNWMLIVGIVVALAVIGAIVFIATGKSRTERYEAKMDAEEDAEEKRQSLERTRDAIKDLADEWEGDVAEGETKAKADAAGWEAEGDDYSEIDMGTSEGTLTMEATVTKEASADVQKLFTGVGGAKTERSEEEKEAMRIENEKRQYQNAIGRLPYGIPSKELADMDWVDLAGCLATCEKRTVEGGKEVAHIDGRWYYTDREDTGTFLKEHGAKPKAERPKAVTTDRDKLLAKLEERFILGEISEDTYKSLRDKYSGK
ncbi:MAG: Ig-like domain-containing protein, partial [Candidatus Thermoplasmatota archaeon]|nr:Ig-like domain-containing protein [Candidatus Thermoplasmatota archaeon]